MVARHVKAKTFGRDDELIAKCETIAQQPMFAGWTVNREGLEAIKSEIDAKGRFFGFAVFLVVPQHERVNAWWSSASLDRYLTRFKLSSSPHAVRRSL